MIEFANGALFESKCDSIGHGCNILGKMGAGIAYDLKIRYPAMFQEYKTQCKNGLFQPGDIFVYETNTSHPPFHILNMATQDCLETAKLDYIRLCCEGVLSLTEKLSINNLGLPQIGTCHGHLPWKEVKEVLNYYFKEAPFQVTIYSMNRFNR